MVFLLVEVPPLNPAPRPWFLLKYDVKETAERVRPAEGKTREEIKEDIL